MSGLNEKSRDPSMEDVLASIRKIIAEELDAAHHAAIEDIGPLDHNLPWAERQSNRQAKKSAPVLPIQAVSDNETGKNHEVHADLDAPSAELSDDGVVANGAITIADTVVSEEHRAAVAEFEQAVTALPVQDIHPITDLPQDIFSSVSGSGRETDEQSAHEAVSEAVAEGVLDSVEGAGAASHWQSAPLPFEVLQFAAEDRETIENAPVAASLVDPVAPDVVAAGLVMDTDRTTHSLTGTDASQVSDVNIYSDFLEAQKPQLNVKLDLSFLDQKFYDHGQADKHAETSASPEVVPEAAPVSVTAQPSADFSIFTGDTAHSTLPPFIPANEPSYSSLVSQRTTYALLSSLRHLTEATRPPAPVGAPREQTLAPRLDEFMADVLRPLLSEWLDANLERIVDQAVRDEIAKVTQKVRS